MDSRESLSQTFNSFTAMTEFNNLRSEPSIRNSEKPRSIAEVITSPSMPTVAISDGFAGSLDVFVHQARDIHNICIYHKQDVYAKLCLTSDPEASVSTKTINGGGRNPVFDENLKLNVRTIDSSLKCEIWMLSGAKDYLGDQLLGFALVPLSEIVMRNGKLTQEFPLSSTDLFHFPAGFVLLSLSYTGSSPDVMAIAASPASTIGDAMLPDAENGYSIRCEYANMEFPDLKVVHENKMMISEYFGIPCTDSEPQNCECMISVDCSDCPDNDAGVRIVQSFSSDNSHGFIGVLKDDTPLSSVISNEPSVLTVATSQADSAPSGSPAQKSKNTQVSESDTSSSTDTSEKAYALPVISVNVEPEQPVVQQEIMDMYMKSMQEFTESLASMKLPMDIENGSSSSSFDGGNATSDKKLQASEKTGARVFYGSRAFF